VQLPVRDGHYPKIGAGLARGDWPTIAAMIDEELAGEDHTLVEFEPARGSRLPSASQARLKPMVADIDGG
jgi:hypothetical protein